MTRSNYRYGFKSEAERLALEVRGELGVADTAPFDPWMLAEHLAIPALPLSQLKAHGASPRSIAHLHGDGRSMFSAVTVFDPPRRLIVLNDSHADVRLTSSLSHELAHVLLEHEPHGVTRTNGDRHWDARMESEADWLGGALLVPRVAAVHVARSETTVEVAAAHYGVSTKLLNWRLDQTGARIQARRGRAR